jgi:hypothetical protein
MKTNIPAFGGLIAALSFGVQAHAAVFSFQVSGGPFSAHGLLTVEPNVSPPDPNPNCGMLGNDACRADPTGAYRITSIKGSFTDTADGIVGASITGLIPISPANERDPLTGGPFDPLVPSSLSFMDSSPVDILGGNFLSYNNLFFPNGSPIDCDFPFVGTFVDVFGLAFTVQGGYRVGLWGDGNEFGPGTTTYGVGVMNSGGILNYQFDGVGGSAAAVPESATWGLMLVGFGSLGAVLRRRRGQVALTT